MNSNVYDKKIMWYTASILLTIIALQIMLVHVILPQYTDDEKLAEYVRNGMFLLFVITAVSLVIIHLRRMKKIMKNMDVDMERIKRQKNEITKLSPHEFLKEKEALKQKLYKIRDKYIPDETPDTTKD